MTDRYERIRAALAMGPTPGPWEWEEGQSIITREWDGKDWPIASVDRSRLGWHENKRCESLEAGANGTLIASCDPDTIRELLAERDALAAENERLREALSGCFCPRPCNHREHGFTVGECVAAGECGYSDGAPLQDLTTTGAAQ